jgi:acylglycerol lipase
MPHHETHFAGYDGLDLYQQCWLPEAESAAVVAVVHGVNEHSGRYARLAEALNRRGYAVYAMDLRGHGKSAGPRAEIRSFDEYLDDLALFLDRVAQCEPGKPLFLLGHSMGGAIAALFVTIRRSRLHGLVLSAPAVLVGGRVFPVLRHLAALFSRITPRLRFVRMGCRFISRDPQIIAEFKRDPLVFHGRFPVRTGAEILRAAKQIQATVQQLELPLLILHGTGDIVTDCEGSRRLHLGAGSHDKTLYLYEGLYHEVLSEPEKEKVIGDLLAWLDARR